MALKILDPDSAERVRGGHWESSRLATAMRAFMAVRRRYAEDQLARAVQCGVKQYAVLGAGLDTFAYRNPHASTGLRGRAVHSFFSPVDLTNELQGMGFTRSEGLPPDEINARYFQDRADGLRVIGKMGRLMSAET